METPIQAILKMLVEPPGNLIYHLVLAFSVASSLQTAIIGRRSSPYPYARRMIFGLGMLLFGQVVLFFSSGLAWQGVIDPTVFLPPLDRAVLVFSLVWIVWLWNFPSPAKLGDLVTGFLVLGVVIFFLFSISAWSAQAATQEFNGSTLDFGWQIAALFVIVTGMAVLLFSRPSGWGFGFGMLSLGLAGFVAHMVFMPQDGSFSGFIRLGQLAAFPLLPTLLNRFSTPAVGEAPRVALPAPAAADSTAPKLQERRRYSSSARTVHAWLELCETTDPQQIISGTARAISHTMLADLCFVVSGPSYGHIVLQSGYDLIREERMPGVMIEQSALPALANALQRSKVLRITSADPQPGDMKTLCTALSLNEPGSLMFIPLSVDEKPQGGLLLLSPYSDRQWSPEDQTYLSSELELVARILRDAVRQGDQTTSTEQAVNAARAELDTLRLENKALLEEISSLRTMPAANAPQAVRTPSSEIDALVALQKESLDQIAALQAENEHLNQALALRGGPTVPADDYAQMETDLRTTLQELAVLQNRLAIANARTLELERGNRQHTGGSNEDREVITSIVQEIRQPMSSILGYTDLLLAESVGILGALQRKFLERIKASTERMHGILNDLLQIAALGEGPVELLPQAVEMGGVIDEAVSDTSAQLREKNITLQVDLPSVIPQIFADRDAIQQIVMHLLQNAGTVTPQEGTITLRSRVTEEDRRNFLLIQVTDSGGGIQPEDLPRVFSRRYRANMPLVQGLGDTGVGLSIARTLVEAHGGRIWVDSVAGQSTTFSVLLPLQPNHDLNGGE